MSLVPTVVHRWRVRLWLAAAAVSERRVVVAYDRLVEREQQELDR